jgi:hypothetical protein
MAFAGKVKAAALAAFLGESPGNSRRIHSRWRYSVQVLPARHILAARGSVPDIGA